MGQNDEFSKIVELNFHAHRCPIMAKVHKIGWRSKNLQVDISFNLRSCLVDMDEK